MNAIIAKLNALKTAQIIEITDALANRFDEEAGIVTDAALDILMQRLPEDEFIAYCDKLAA